MRELLEKAPVVPVVVLEDASKAVPVATSLVDGGRSMISPNVEKSVMAYSLAFEAIAMASTASSVIRADFLPTRPARYGRTWRPVRETDKAHATTPREIEELRDQGEIVAYEYWNRE